MIESMCLGYGNRQRFPRCMDIVVTQKPGRKGMLKIASYVLIVEMGKWNLRHVTSPMRYSFFVVELWKREALLRNWGFNKTIKDQEGIQWAACDGRMLQTKGRASVRPGGKTLRVTAGMVRPRSTREGQSWGKPLSAKIQEESPVLSLFFSPQLLQPLLSEDSFLWLISFIRYHQLGRITEMFIIVLYSLFLLKWGTL